MLDIVRSLPRTFKALESQAIIVLGRVGSSYGVEDVGRCNWLVGRIGTQAEAIERPTVERSGEVEFSARRVLL